MKTKCNLCSWYGAILSKASRLLHGALSVMEGNWSVATSERIQCPGRSYLSPRSPGVENGMQMFSYLKFSGVESRWWRATVIQKWKENLYEKREKLLADFWLTVNKHPSYMASSASGQDEPNRALWLATRAGKMETTRCIPQARFHQKPYIKSFIDQVCSVKMAGYWPRSFFLRVYGPRLRLGP